MESAVCYHNYSRPFQCFRILLDLESFKYNTIKFKKMNFKFIDVLIKRDLTHLKWFIITPMSHSRLYIAHSFQHQIQDLHTDFQCIYYLFKVTGVKDVFFNLLHTKHKQCSECCYLYLRGRHVNSQCDQRQNQYDVGKRVVWNTQTITHICTGQPTQISVAIQTVIWS